MKKLLALLLTIALVFSLTACGGSDQPSGDAQSSDGNSEKSVAQILTVTKNADLNTMDPQYATDGLSFEAIAACIDGLYTLDKDSNAIPALAEKTEVSDDGLQYTFYLRDSKWSNGEPVTAHDFVYAWQRLASPELASGYNYMIDIASIKNAGPVLQGEVGVEELGVMAKDDKTLVVMLDKPVPYFDKLMAFPSFYPTNKAFAEAQGDQFGLTPENMIYNGAFIWKEWISGNSFTFEKNPDYWDAAAVKLEKLIFKVALDAQSAVLDFESGNTNYVYLTGELVDKYKDKEGYQIELGSYLWWLQANHHTDKFDNENLVKAIALSYNREQIANNVLKDGAIAAYFFVPRKLAADANGVDFRDTCGDFFTGSKDDAKAHWEKAKQEMGITEFEWELLFEDSEQSKKVAEFIKSEVEANLEGMTVNLKSQPKKTRLQIMRGTEDDYDFGLTRWGPDYADPMTYLELYQENAAGEPGRGGYNDPHYNELIALTKSGTQTTEERWQTMMEAEKYLLESAMGPIPVYQTGAAQIWDPRVKEAHNHNVGIPYIYKWAYIEE